MAGDGFGNLRHQIAITREPEVVQRLGCRAGFLDEDRVHAFEVDAQFEEFTAALQSRAFGRGVLNEPSEPGEADQTCEIAVELLRLSLAGVRSLNVELVVGFEKRLRPRLDLFPMGPG